MKLPTPLCLLMFLAALSPSCKPTVADDNQLYTVLHDFIDTAARYTSPENPILVLQSPDTIVFKTAKELQDNWRGTDTVIRGRWVRILPVKTLAGADSIYTAAAIYNPIIWALYRKDGDWYLDKNFSSRFAPPPVKPTRKFAPERHR